MVGKITLRKIDKVVCCLYFIDEQKHRYHARQGGDLSDGAEGAFNV